MTIVYPNGGSNRMWEPMHIFLPIGFETSLTLIGRTCGRDGCTITLLDEKGKSLQSRNYFSGMGMIINRQQIAKEFCEDINFCFASFEDKDKMLTPKQILKAIEELVEKSESRYGKLIPDSDYEAKLFFIN